MARPFSWSLTRSRSLGGCPRAHLLRYHSYRIRGLEDTPALARMTSPEMLAGDAVDHAARKVALHLSRGGTLPSEERIVAVGLARYDERLSERAHHTRNLVEGVEIPREIELTVLQHEYYGHEPQAGRDLEDMRLRAEERLRSLARSGLLKRIASLPPGSILLPKAGMPRQRRLFGSPAYAQPDLVVRDEAGPVIVDWKAGEDRHEARVAAGWQLAAYAAVEAQEALVAVGSVRVQAAFLASSPEWEPKPARAEDVDALRERMARDREEERGFAERAENCRKGGTDWRTAATPYPTPGLCARCPFLELCVEGREASAERRLRGRAYLA